MTYTLKFHNAHEDINYQSHNTYIYNINPYIDIQELSKESHISKDCEVIIEDDKAIQISETEYKKRIAFSFFLSMKITTQDFIPLMQDLQEFVNNCHNAIELLQKYFKEHEFLYEEDITKFQTMITMR